MKRITLKEFIEQDIDKDIYDNVCEDIGIAFVGPCKLTQDGEKEFRRILNLPVEYEDNDDENTYEAVVIIDETDRRWQDVLKDCNKFFIAAAGYCSCAEYDAWFED